MAAAVARAAASKLDEKELEDEWTARLGALAAKKKRKGEDVVEAPVEDEEEADDGKVIDLLEVLKRSMEAAGTGGGGGKQRKAASRATRKSPSGASGRGLEALSKKELYERAQERDLPGRSAMTREELIEALRGAA